MLLLGIDEAGRGPVIGPMVIAGVVIKEEKEKELRELGVRDSKELTRKEREDLFEKLLKIIDGYKIEIISPNKIDEYVYNGKLNILEIKTIIKIIENLKADKIIIDSPMRNVYKVLNYIKNNISYSPEIIVDIKADKNYIVVSAASIIAKVIRDREIDKIKKIVNIDFGSGYPSDPKTIKAIKEHYDVLENFIRKSWKTIRSSKQKSIKDFLTKNKYFYDERSPLQK